VTLSVVIITFNEEANLPHTLESVKWADEIIVVDSGSTDRTVEIAKSYGAKVWVEPWKGFAAQKNSALEKATGDWILSLDADEEVSPELTNEIKALFQYGSLAETREWCLTMRETAPIPSRALEYLHGKPSGYYVPRKNFFLGRWVRHGGFYPDRKLRFIARGFGQFEDRAVHEDARVTGSTSKLKSSLIHHAYPTLSGYIEHMNRYSSLGAEMKIANGPVGFSFVNIVLRPLSTFLYNYFFRLGFLDGREGLLLHLYHSVYVSWKYAKVWEISRSKKP
jgi:glycosyltransferase involved in cell wall biosynthesis